jgi:hypothetical protein
MDLARSIQDISEEVMLKMTAFAHRETGMATSLAGGVALNCVGNGRILREGPFDQSGFSRRQEMRSLWRRLALSHRYSRSCASARKRSAPGSAPRPSTTHGFLAMPTA